VAPERPDESDDLYALDPSEFVTARNDLVRQLKADGRRDEAATVARLRRPTPSAWALNVVARRDPDLVQRALDVGHELKDATDAAVGGNAEAFKRTVAEDQAASGAVIDAAQRVLGDRGPGLATKISGTLRAAILDDEVADELRRGVLDAEHEASGFAFGAAVASAPAGTSGRRSGAKSKQASAGNRSRSDERAAKREQRTRLKEKVRELRERAAEAEREAKQRERAASAARKAADEAARALDDARRQLDEE
jgi:hypothetical protein